MPGTTNDRTGSLTGPRAEDAACTLLQRKGLHPIERNYRCRLGEVDLIMRDDNCLVFVEVRYRRGTRFGSPAESISWAKKRRIIATAAHYIQGLTSSPPCRFDVVAITGNEPYTIDWIKDAFQL